MKTTKLEDGKPENVFQRSSGVDSFNAGDTCHQKTVVRKLK